MEEVRAGSFLDELPARLVGDKAYDSDALDQKLADEYDIELIAPNRQRRSQTQDGRKLRRYRRRWRVERLFAWMHHFRRLVTRWEYHIENFLGFVQLACLHICSGIYETASRPASWYAIPEYLLRNHPNRPQPRLHQLRPSGYWKLRAPQPERMPALRVQMHLHGNPRVLQRNVVSH